ncbi:OprO/OprP family phosphate-selective porin [Shewanella colwelliana]|uniref:Porin n=1 Tax=Shewanella colwelliana TaxID=23 RepID=A0A1E5IUX4_SHECO|nr:porin [Shewanella colwelliana]MCZ4337990.1 porin [Shewanella colwelliana]MDX1281131.1 porin [Shewanella colwelliana]OEG73763.1 porin [Shewanella colwelliana]GIU22550.1 porin [Shewanella colwelliana]GIU37961.1 porin [Shewanella colwelliana]
MNSKKMFSISPIALAISASVLCFSSAVMATETDKVLELEERLNALEMELIEAKDAANKVDRVKFSKDSPSPALISQDGRSTLEFKARIQADYVKADELYKNGGDYVESFTDASIRRLRFGIEGYFSNSWEYELELDFDGLAEVEVKDANVTYKGWDNSTLKLGFQKYAFGMEATGSSAHLAFLERASTDSFSPDRALGVQWRYVGNNYNLHLGYGVITENEFEETDDQNHAKMDMLNARFTMAPINSNGHLLHIGASGLYNNLNDDAAKSLRYRARPNTKPTERIVDTGKIKAESGIHYGAELAYQYSNLLLQAEYMTASVDQIDDPKVSVNSYYAQAVYTITGEKWRYSGKKGTFKAVSPDSPISSGGWGAWEVALRVDQANFDDVDAGIEGGKKTDYVLGLNWYLEDNLKAQLNYVHTQADYVSPYTDINGVEQYDQDGNIFQARLQFAF